MRPPATTDFDRDLTELLPRMRAYALSLTHDRDHADDLVQETAAKALAGRASFRPGTNFAAWLFRIERNEFISSLRRTRFAVPLDDSVAGGLSCPPRQEGGLVMRDFLGALRRLSDEARRSLLLAGLEGQCHKQIAELCGVSVGTVKSRTCRARTALKQMLEGQPGGDGCDHENAQAVRRPTVRRPCSRRPPVSVPPMEIEPVRGGDYASRDMPCARAHGGAGRDDRAAPVAPATRVGRHSAGRPRHRLPLHPPASQLNVA
ncbi:MAG: sigma-70 family RNA polymerase sigma factor [Reyranella sp.]|nr:sigma-70 family RNA polymerase sigma factor [Reyranella sp.]MDP2372253.1 sigma-70 family RNA polymerase sigma factor [Reyranella sp.]